MFASALFMASISWVLLLSPVAGDPPAADPQPVAATQRSDQTEAPAAQDDKAAEPVRQPLSAAVLAVSGSADRADRGVPASGDTGWTPVKVGETLASGTQIRTGRRSSIDLRFGESTYVHIGTATYATIDEFFRSATTEVVRIGLGYGMVRGGSFEGTVHGDVIVDTPTATLAKRGTDGWEIMAEAGTGRFRMSLANEGLVEAIQRARRDGTESRLVRPGEYATEANIASLWVRQATFDRNVTYYDQSWITAADAAYSTDATSGMSVVAPGLGADAWGYAARGNSDWVREQIDMNFSDGLPPNLGGRPPFVVLPPLQRPEGNFGTGTRR